LPYMLLSNWWLLFKYYAQSSRIAFLTPNQEAFWGCLLTVVGFGVFLIAGFGSQSSLY